MDDMDKIHIKLELCKDKGSGFTIVAHFNPNAPNFFKEGKNYSWMPTSKERTLIYEAFNLVSTDDNKNPNEKNILKFSNGKPSSEKTNQGKKNSSDFPTFEKTKKDSNTIEITAENEDFDNNIYKEDKINTNESDKQSINETLERQKIIENSLSEEENKERKIDKILIRKKRYK